MNLPEGGCVDPAKAREVSRSLPIKLWMGEEELIELLAQNIEVLQANQMECSPEAARQIEIRVAQRELWIEWLGQCEEDEAFVGLVPASPGGDDHNDEAAVALGDDPDAG